MSGRRIQIDFSLDDDGLFTVRRDVDELGLGWDWLLRELTRLSDDEILGLFEEDEAGRAGAEGAWGLLDLDPYWLICQLQMTEPYTWRVGTGQGWLKVVRMYRRRGVDVAIKELRRLEEESERRSQETTGS